MSTETNPVPAAKKNPVEGKSTVNFMGNTLYTEQGVQERVAEELAKLAQAPEAPQKSDAEATPAAVVAESPKEELPLVDQAQNLTIRSNGINNAHNALMVDFEFPNWAGSVEFSILDAETKDLILKGRASKDVNQALVIANHNLNPGKYILKIRDSIKDFTIAK